MPMSKDDRIAFSLKIVGSDAEIKGLESAKAALLTEQVKIQKLDDANKNLFDPVNALVNAYHGEVAKLDGIVRQAITEQNIQDSGGKKIRNPFFPNDLSASVPSLSGLNNVWPRVQPFALTFSIGKNYVEVYPGSTAKEQDLVDPVLSLISSASAFTDIEKTSGQKTDIVGGSCSLPLYTTQATCIAATPVPGVWTPGVNTIVSYPAVLTLATNLTTAVNNLKTFLLAEVALIPTTDTVNAAANDAARDDINNVIIPALNTWLAYLDYKNVPPGTLPANFNAYNPSLLAPTKLHSTELTALQSALTTRVGFVATRKAQILGYLGSISQDVNTGDVTAQTGLYGKRYNMMSLRLNALGGSLTQLLGLKTSSGAQDSIVANIKSTKSTYMAILPTSMLKANASGSNIIHVVDASFLAAGDQIFIYADKQEELVRGVKSVNGQMVTLSEDVPAKYTTSTKARIYKDLT